MQAGNGREPVALLRSVAAQSERMGSCVALLRNHRLACIIRHMLNRITRNCCLSLWLVLGPALPVDAAPTEAPASGSVQGTLLLDSIVSTELASERQLFVWLPNSYGTATKKHYPVLYALQGENLFETARAAGGEEWAVDELLVREPTGIPEWIVVGIGSAPNAVREYATPGSRVDAQADVLLRFITKELKPHVDRTWRTLPDAAHSYVLGMGTSALTAIYAAWVHSEYFAGAIALELPDVDTAKVLWPAQPPAVARPWLWLEQRSSERSRHSNSRLFTDLQRHGDVRVLVAGPTASHPARLAPALRAIPLPVVLEDVSSDPE